MPQPQYAAEDALFVDARASWNPRTTQEYNAHAL